MTSSTDGIHWTAVQRIPLDPVSSAAVDHLLASLAVDKSTAGASAHLGLMYYYVPQGTNCTVSTCDLDVGFASSTNGGNTWSAPTLFAGPIKQTWLANTNQGYMVGDYFSASFANGKCFPVFSVAAAPSSTGVFNQAIDTWAGGLTITGGTRSGTGSRVYVRRLHSAATSTRRTAN